MLARSLTISEAEYFRLDAQSDERIEYWHGQPVAMAGAQPDHSTIKDNVVFALRSQRPDCIARTSGVRVHAPGYRASHYAYPDGLLICGPEQYDDRANPPILLNPSLLIEVVSESTARLDLGDKLDAYLRIESLHAYWIIDAEQVMVRRCQRTPEGILIQTSRDPAAELVSDTLALRLPIAAIYHGVSWFASR